MMLASQRLHAYITLFVTRTALEAMRNAPGPDGQQNDDVREDRELRRVFAVHDFR